MSFSKRAIHNGHRCCKRQKDGREECEKKDSEACHCRTGECQDRKCWRVKGETLDDREFEGKSGDAFIPRGV